MRYLLTGLFILAFLAGVMTMGTNHPNNQPGVVGKVLNAVGFTKMQAEQNSKTTQIIEALRDQRLALSNNMQDQQGMLKQAGDQREGLAQMVRDLSDKSNVDVLRLKDLMGNFEEQNRLLINQGHELIQFNEDQLKIRGEFLHDASWENMKSGIEAKHFLEVSKEAFDQRADFINKSLTNTQAIREQTEALHEKLLGLEDHLTTSQNAQLIIKIKEASERSKEILITIKSNEDRLHDLLKQNELTALKFKERLADFVELNKEKFSDAQEILEDQRRINKDRTDDLIRRIRDERNH